MAGLSQLPSSTDVTSSCYLQQLQRLSVPHYPDARYSLDNWVGGSVSFILGQQSSLMRNLSTQVNAASVDSSYLQDRVALPVLNSPIYATS